MAANKNVRPRLLAVLAHPDDESFGAGGTLARYAWMGAQVDLICATGGEEGAAEDRYLVGYSSLAERRAAELQCAAQALGLQHVIRLDYRDSGMAGTPANQHPQALVSQPLATVVGRLVVLIRQLRPHVVITFDPIGGYRHPDHIAIHEATVAAFHAAGDPAYHSEALLPWQPQKLYYQTFPRQLLRTVVRLMPFFGYDPRRFGRNNDVDLAALANVDFPVHARIDTLAVMEARIAAGRCHASQGGEGFARSPWARLIRTVGLASVETFMRAYPEAPPGLREDDLLAGVRW
ncbi:PIG-L family deacetylase [Candidatus Viridilinea mediisalina]|uniref:GlcNAc-PI de-N-acetylase n=1 Tax=Candidatus Viridilinea mediisalina TaxID=2024553 RepID=A0A2A6RK92_9CHLR|nr:PIG-L family deacetylase [Candidatus Viridilinea mediisalina]PDW03477.1 GlcNAc-PI de-N-acetylase [Candidatus Viridilinea mediisalina]